MTKDDEEWSRALDEFFVGFNNPEKMDCILQAAREDHIYRMVHEFYWSDVGSHFRQKFEKELIRRELVDLSEIVSAKPVIPPIESENPPKKVEDANSENAAVEKVTPEQLNKPGPISQYWKDHHQWIITTAVGIAMVAAAFLAL